jgi:small subunit ribosomal protein S20
MPNIKSMKKDLKRNAKKHDRNTSAKSALKTFIKKARIAEGEGAAAAVGVAVKQLDKAAQRGIIHKNQASRRKSRLMKAAAKTGA